MVKKFKKYEPLAKINDQIRHGEVRVLDSEGKNIGLMSSEKALQKAIILNLDLVEISDKSKPVLVKIVDYGKFRYDKKKKDKEIKSKTKLVETKNIQVKVGTSEGDLILKAKNISKWLKDSQRVKLNLFLRGRVKYLEKNFLEERLKRILKLLTISYKIADGPKKGPKGLTLFLEKGTKNELDEIEGQDNKK